MEKGINILKEELMLNKGADVIIDICHKLYGNQKIRCILDYIFDEKRIGFRANNKHEVFIHRENLVDYGVNDGIYFADNVMRIKIKLNRVV